MTINVAWPACHRPDGKYAEFAGAVVRGRRYRQPIAHAAGCVDGLELWFKRDSNARELHACLDGKLTFEAAKGGLPAGLRLDVLQVALARIDPTLEANLKWIATCRTARSPALQRRTASALNSALNFRRFRFAMALSRRILAPSRASTEALCSPLSGRHFGTTL
jgi:hypothetical protein